MTTLVPCYRSCRTVTVEGVRQLHMAERAAHLVEHVFPDVPVLRRGRRRREMRRAQRPPRRHVGPGGPGRR